MRTIFGRRCAAVLALAALVLGGCAATDRTGASGPAWKNGPAPEFVLPPVAKFEKDGVRIQFWVSRATDVAVFVRNGDGRVVRHLVAGMLGPNAPAPLARNSLAQSLVWDGRDDRGREVGSGVYFCRMEAAGFDDTAKMVLLK